MALLVKQAEACYNSLVIVIEKISCSVRDEKIKKAVQHVIKVGIW